MHIPSPKYILGISAFFHDSAAAILVDGEIVAAAEEERFSRIKHDKSFPEQAIRFCLAYSDLSLNDLDAIVFYEKPFLKFERILQSYYDQAPYGLASFVKAMPHWFGEKLFIKNKIHKNLKNINSEYSKKINILFPEHHLSHAASAFFASPHKEAAILTIDGVGEWATSTISYGKGNGIKILKELHFPHSVGLLYSAFTYFLGFKVNSGEYKLMGLSAYGNPDDEQTQAFIQLIKKKLVKIFADGSIELALPYFGFLTSMKMVRDAKWEKLFDFERRREKDELRQEHFNLALAIQKVTEEIVVKMALEAKRLTGSDYLCMAGGVALNCVINGNIRKENIFKNIYIQPAAGDAGGAIGAALAAWHIYFEQARFVPKNTELPLPFLGPKVLDGDVLKLLDEFDLDVQSVDSKLIMDVLAAYLAAGKAVAYCRGRMEFGPRALGNRSILGDARDPKMQNIINQKIKKRESFRPFAPAILEEEVETYFDCKGSSPYMLFVYPVNKKFRNKLLNNFQNKSILEKLNFNKSKYPAVTHVDFSARVQTVSKNQHPQFHQLLTAFHKLTGSPMLINTSFNERGEPIVCTARDAFFAFMRMGVDVLVLNNYVLRREDVAHLDVTQFLHDFERD